MVNLAQLIKFGKTLFIFQSLVLLILLISEVNIWTSTLSVIVLTLQIIAGSSLLLTFVNKSEFTWQEIVGLGIVLGSILTFGFDQIFRNTPIAIFAWSIPVILSPLVFWRYLNKSEEKFRISVSTRAELTILFAAAFLILATEWFWPLPLAIMLIAIYFGLQTPRLRIYAMGVAAIFAPISIFSIFLRPQGWWIEDSDVALYEAMSKTLGTWGFRDNINGANTPTNYHWFTYAWSGLIDRVGNFSPWVSNTRVIPIFLVVGVCLLTWSIAFRLTNSKTLAGLALVLVASFDTSQLWGRGFKVGYIMSPSQIYGLLVLLAFFLVYSLYQEHLVKSPYLILGILAFSTLGAKVAHGALLVGGAGFVWLCTVLKERRILSKNTVVTIFSVVPVLACFQIIFGGPSGSSRGMIFQQVGFVDSISGAVREFSNEIHWVAAFIYIFGFFGLPIILFIQSKSLKLLRNTFSIQFVLGSSIVGLLVTVFLSAEFGVQLFFAQGATVLSLSLLLPTVIQTINFQSKKNITKVTVRVSYLIGFGSALFALFFSRIEIKTLLKFEFRQDLQILLIYLVPSIVGLFSLIFAFLGAVFWLKNTEDPIIKNSFLLLSTTGLLAMSIGFYSTNWYVNIKNEYPSLERNYEINVGLNRPNLIRAAEWIHQNTDENAIFATNDFCSEISEDCNPSTNWNLKMDRSMTCTQEEVLLTPTCDAGGYALLTALVDRRFLAGNYYVGISDGSAIKPWVAKRVIDSVNFAKFANVKATQILKDQNVEWFLLRKELTVSQDWQKYGTIEYSNDSYAIIKLN